MLDHTGKKRTRFEDVFRAMGRYLDEQNFSQITIVETPDGFLVKGFMLVDGSEGFRLHPATYLFTDADVDALVETAYDRRGNES